MIIELDNDVTITIICELIGVIDSDAFLKFMKQYFKYEHLRTTYNGYTFGFNKIQKSKIRYLVNAPLTAEYTNILSCDHNTKDDFKIPKTLSSISFGGDYISKDPFIYTPLCNPNICSVKFPQSYSIEHIIPGTNRNDNIIELWLNITLLKTDFKDQLMFPHNLKVLHITVSDNVELKRIHFPDNLEELYIGFERILWNFGQKPSINIHKNILPNTIKTLSLWTGFDQKLTLDMLPESLDTLIIDAMYKHSLSFPNIKIIRRISHDKNSKMMIERFKPKMLHSCNVCTYGFTCLKCAYEDI